MRTATSVRGMSHATLNLGPTNESEGPLIPVFRFAGPLHWGVSCYHQRPSGESVDSSTPISDGNFGNGVDEQFEFPFAVGAEEMYRIQHDDRRLIAAGIAALGSPRCHAL